MGAFTPDVTFYLDLSVEEGMRRAQSRGVFDRIEQQSLISFIECMLLIWKRLIIGPNIIRIDASMPVGEVQQAIALSFSHFIERLDHE